MKQHPEKKHTKDLTMLAKGREAVLAKLAS